MTTRLLSRATASLLVAVVAAMSTACTTVWYEKQWVSPEVKKGSYKTVRIASNGDVPDRLLVAIKKARPDLVFVTGDADVVLSFDYRPSIHATWFGLVTEPSVANIAIEAVDPHTGKLLFAQVRHFNDVSFDEEVVQPLVADLDKHLF